MLAARDTVIQDFDELQLRPRLYLVGGRCLEIDRLRGLAIVLMILDHTLVLVDPGSFIRFSLTRLALPLFALIAGHLSAGPLAPVRFLQLGAAAVLATVLGFGWIGQPDILTLFLFCYAVRPFWSLPLLVAAVLQPSVLAFDWTGYSPGLVLALMIIGREVVFRSQLVRWGSGLPAFLGFLGKWPLSWYCGHLAFLAFFRYLFL